jgi:hypothetical protein
LGRSTTRVMVVVDPSLSLSVSPLASWSFTAAPRSHMHSLVSRNSRGDVAIATLCRSSSGRRRHHLDSYCLCMRDTGTGPPSESPSPPIPSLAGLQQPR